MPRGQVEQRFRESCEVNNQFVHQYADQIVKLTVLIVASLQTREKVLRFGNVSRGDQVQAPLPALRLARMMTTVVCMAL